MAVKLCAVKTRPIELEALNPVFICLGFVNLQLFHVTVLVSSDWPLICLLSILTGNENNVVVLQLCKYTIINTYSKWIPFS